MRTETFDRVCSNILHIDSLDVVRIESCYEQPHRYFHTMSHIESLFQSITDCAHPDVTPQLRRALYLAAIYHDIVYHPGKDTNEQMSAHAIFEDLPGIELSHLPALGFEGNDRDIIRELVLGTALRSYSSSTPFYVKLFNSFDRKILRASLPELLAYGHLIYKEYSFVPYSVFVTEHVKLLRELNLCDPSDPLQSDASVFDVYEAGLKAWRPRVGLYAGSFNPWHRGHEDILLQAARQFDKVVVAVGRNPDKVAVTPKFSVQPTSLAGVPVNVEAVSFTGALWDLCNYYKTSQNYEVSIVRGLRSAEDLSSELIQRRFVHDFNRELPYVFFASAPDVSHISSSAIRALLALGRDVSNYVPSEV